MLSQSKVIVRYKLTDKETLQERSQRNTQGEGEEEGCWLHNKSTEQAVHILNEN